MKKLVFLFITCSFISSIAQNKELSIEDAVLGFSKGLYPKSINNLQWVDQSNSYVYSKDNSYQFVDAKSNKTVKSLSLENVQRVYPDMKYLPRLQYVSGTNMTFRTRNAFESFNYMDLTKLNTLAIESGAQNIEYNRKAKAIAYTLENNLFVGTARNSKIAVTTNKDKNVVSGQAIHRSEFGILKGTFWSPKGSYLAFYQKDESNVTTYPLVDVTTYPASSTPVKYPMAGQGSEIAKIGFFNMATSKTHYLNIDTSDEHYLTNLSWSPDEKYLMTAEINRGQNHVWYNRYDVQTGEKVNTLFEETSSKWTEPEFDAVFLPNNNTDFLWFSERDGFMNLYLYNLDGKLIKQLTDFDWVVTAILGFDQKGKHVFISGTGPDARESHVYKVNIASGKFTALTKQAATHRTSLNSNGTFLIDQYSNIDTPLNIDIVDTKKGKSRSIHQADNPLEDYKIGKTEFINLKSKDGTTLHAKLIKPYLFDSTKKYPVLVYVYGGPHAQLVTNSWGTGSSLWMPAFASLENYIVFTLDNRGSANRGFEFESGIHRQLGELEMEDQLTGIEYLKSLKFVDSNRIAVNGWSYGGFMTTSLMLRHPGVFTTAVAGGPVTDWKYYEVMYGERYMDTPQENPDGYKKSKIHNYISNLDGKMLIIHGSVDPTVVPQHSMTLLHEAVKKKVQIDFFTYPMHPHNVRGVDRVHLVDKMLEYIIENNQ